MTLDTIPGGEFNSNEKKIFVSEKPTWTKEHITGEGKVIYGDVEYTYLILNQKSLAEKVPVPKQFATYTVNEKGFPVVLSVSENYPEQYRDLCVLHEIIEKVECSGMGEEECLHALKKELEIALESDIDMKDYVPVRIKFFEDVIEYYEAQPDSPEKADLLPRLKKSLEYLVAMNV